MKDEKKVVALPSSILSPCCGVQVDNLIDNDETGRLPVDGELIDCLNCGASVMVVSDGLKVLKTRSQREDEAMGS